MIDPTIRAATEADVPEIVRMQLASRRVAYEPIFKEAFVQPPAADREREWCESLASQPTETRHWLLWHGDELVACCSSGRSRIGEAPAADEGELWSINAAPDAIGTDAGWRIVSHAMQDLRERGFTSVALMCLEQNVRARRFYERAGFIEQGTIELIAPEGTRITDVVYRRAL